MTTAVTKAVAKLTTTSTSFLRLHAQKVPHASFSDTAVAPMRNRILTAPNGMNAALLRMDYAVRGALVQRAERLAQQLRDPVAAAQLPFKQIVYCNIGNPQSVGQPPITFVRQVLAGLACPSLLKQAGVAVPADVSERVHQLLHQSHGIGAYSESPGIPMIREHVAHAITARDGVFCDPDNLFLTNGASEGVKTLLSMLVRDSSDGIMIPIPQYPLYSASMTALGGVQVPYFLDEENGWSLDLDELQRSLHTARANGVTVRGLVVINPGNPTGQVLSRQNLEAVIKFCEQENLVILADEVYQKNTYADEKPFISFKKVATDLGSKIELASFHSVSKGVMGECGLRGGYVEVHNMSKEARELIYKVLSVSLCSGIVGQAAVQLMMNPPKQGDPSYDLYETETSTTFKDLKNKSLKLSSAMKSFEGVSCNRSEGAMYLFPRITLPHGAIAESKKQGMPAADVLYCSELLDATGICVVPGSGFGQREGTLHFRTTFLPPSHQIDIVATEMRGFHRAFLEKYS